jgi:hypothetical protein
MSLGREAILGFKDNRIGRVDVSEMGGSVCIASLTVGEADRIRTLGDDGVPAVVGLVILGACDENGKRLFTAKDESALTKLPADALTKIANMVLKHNGMAGGDDSEEVKNDSSETANDASASASPLPSEDQSKS